MRAHEVISFAAAAAPGNCVLTGDDSGFGVELEVSLSLARYRNQCMCLKYAEYCGGT